MNMIWRKVRLVYQCLLVEKSVLFPSRSCVDSCLRKTCLVKVCSSVLVVQLSTWSLRRFLQWRHCDSAPSKIIKTFPSAGKVITTIFWNFKRILLIDYLENGPKYEYVALLDYVKVVIYEKNRNFSKKKCNSIIALFGKKLEELRYQIVLQRSYSQDLAPSDFHLFPRAGVFIGR